MNRNKTTTARKGTWTDLNLCLLVGVKVIVRDVEGSNGRALGTLLWRDTEFHGGHSFIA